MVAETVPDGVKLTEGEAAAMRVINPALVLGVLTTAFCGAGASAGEARLAIAPYAAKIKLDEISLYEVGYAYRGDTEQRFPVGWMGDFEEHTGVACMPVGEQNGKKAFLLHPPWRNGTGITFQQFTFRLPRVKRITLMGATAMRSDITDSSDGVIFRVYAGGRKLMDVHRTDSNWQPFHFDLTPLAGKTIVIRFETDPGPKDDSGWDFALWGDRMLVLQGFNPPPAVRPEPPPMKLSKVLSARTGSVVPPDAFGGSRAVSLENDEAVYRYAGSDGMLEYRWRPPEGNSDCPLGSIALHAQMKGDKPVDLSLAGGARIEWSSPAKFESSRWEASGDAVTCVAAYRLGALAAVIRLTGRMVGKSLVMEVSCDQALISAFDAGDWGDRR